MILNNNFGHLFEHILAFSYDLVAIARKKSNLFLKTGSFTSKNLQVENSMQGVKALILETWAFENQVISTTLAQCDFSRKQISDARKKKDEFLLLAPTQGEVCF